MYRFIQNYPSFIHLLRTNTQKLNVRALTHLLKANFSESGSNALSFEKNAYSAFVRYIRQAASGRRVVVLENILEYVTGATEEPSLGFAIQPCIEFFAAEAPSGVSNVLFYLLNLSFSTHYPSTFTLMENPDVVSDI